jgi:structural maintenance of chromosome 2
VGNLQELVYKQGQAGVSKATVTIVFNNSDTANSPVGYESHKTISVTRQVVIGGKNKYIINGHTVQQNQVQNLFHSVQLNVNNPHFLIMQGRITKVLNMKPAETLSMIEEAAGTRMYETKKQAAVKTMEKKQLKVDEITQVMDKEIQPTLDNLKTERANYNKWLANSTEVEKLERFVVAFDFTQCEQRVNSSEGDKAAIVQEISDLEQSQRDHEADAVACTQNIEQICAQRDSEMEGSFQELKQTENELSKDLVKQSTLLSNQKESLAGEQNNLVALKKQIDVASTQLQDKKQKLAACERELVEKDTAAQTAEQNGRLACERYQNAMAGVVDENAGADTLSLPEQVAMWEKRSRETQSALQTGILKCDHLRSSVATKKKTQISQKQAYDAALTVVSRSKDKLATLETKQSKLTEKLSAEPTVRSQVAALRTNAQTLRDFTEKLSAQLEARLNFEFSSPTKGFDRSKVKGLVAKLITVPDRQHATALEVVAGAKLYQVVVDNEQTGKLLLQNGNLKKRVTILPLNKIDNRCLPSEVMDRARRIADARHASAHLALELVGCDDSVRAAMEYVFGSTIICENAELAQAIAFDRQIRTKTVTLDGDVYDPSGTLTGVRRNSSSRCRVLMLTCLCVCLCVCRVPRTILASFSRSWRSWRRPRPNCGSARRSCARCRPSWTSCPCTRTS